MNGTQNRDYAWVSIDELRFSDMSGEELLKEAGKHLEQAWKLLTASADKEHSEPFVAHKIVTIANLVARAIDDSISVTTKIDVKKEGAK